MIESDHAWCDRMGERNVRAKRIAKMKNKQPDIYDRISFWVARNMYVMVVIGVAIGVFLFLARNNVAP